MGLTSPSLLAAALSYFRRADDTGNHPVGASGPCSVSPKIAHAAALRAIAAAAAAADAGKEQLQQQQDQLLSCSAAYVQCLADAETAAAAAATAASPDGVSSKDQ